MAKLTSGDLCVPIYSWGFISSHLHCSIYRNYLYQVQLDRWRREADVLKWVSSQGWGDEGIQGDG